MTKDWPAVFGAGYQDARERTPYARAPEPGSPPPVPDTELPEEWVLYLDGWDAGVKDGVAETRGRLVTSRPWDVAARGARAVRGGK